MRRTVLLAWLGALVLPACAGIATIPPGHAGVLITSDGIDPTLLTEGDATIPPFGRVEIYSLRDQQSTEDLVALTADGAPVEARASVVSYRIVPDELVALVKEVGPDYYHVIVLPILRSTVREVIAGHRADDIGSYAIPFIEREIATRAAARMRPYHLVLDGVDMRDLAIEVSASAYVYVTETGIKEQQALSAPQNLAIAKANADALRTKAKGIADSHAIIEKTLTPASLADASIRAWTALVAAPQSSTYVEAAGRAALLEVTP